MLFFEDTLTINIYTRVWECIIVVNIYSTSTSKCSCSLHSRFISVQITTELLLLLKTKANLQEKLMAWTLPQILTPHTFTFSMTKGFLGHFSICLFLWNTPYLYIYTLLVFYSEYLTFLLMFLCGFIV